MYNPKEITSYDFHKWPCHCAWICLNWQQPLATLATQLNRESRSLHTRRTLQLLQLWPWLWVTTGYFSGIIHFINGVISTYNWYRLDQTSETLKEPFHLNGRFVAGKILELLRIFQPCLMTPEGRFWKKQPAMCERTDQLNPIRILLDNYISAI